MQPLSCLCLALFLAAFTQRSSGFQFKIRGSAISGEEISIRWARNNDEPTSFVMRTLLKDPKPHRVSSAALPVHGRSGEVKLVLNVAGTYQALVFADAKELDQGKAFAVSEEFVVKSKTDGENYRSSELVPSAPNSTNVIGAASTATTQPTSSMLSPGIIAGSVIGGILACTILVALLLLHVCRRRQRARASRIDMTADSESRPPSPLTLYHIAPFITNPGADHNIPEKFCWQENASTAIIGSTRGGHLSSSRAEDSSPAEARLNKPQKAQNPTPRNREPILDVPPPVYSVV